MGTNAIVGGGVPQAAGFAWADRQAGTDAVSVTYFGDGAINIGSTLETFNLAAAWQLPVCFFVENNRYAVSTSVVEATCEPRLSGRGPRLRHPQLEGRRDGPARGPPGDAGGGRAHARRRRPDGRRGRHLPLLPPERRLPGQRVRLPDQGGGAGVAAARPDRPGRRPPRPPRPARPRTRSTPPCAGAAAADGRDRRRAARAAARRPPGPAPDQGGRVARPRASSTSACAGDLSEFDGAPLADRDTYTGELAEQKFIDAVAAVMNRRMETDPSVVVMGEDVHRLNGGTNGATRGLKDRFPDRILGTPISENAFAGLGGGIAIDGRFRPGRRVHVRRLHVGRRRPAVQPDRQGPAHVRRRRAPCRSCCAARSPWAPATGRSTRWTRPASSPPTRAGGSSRRPRRSTTSGLMNSALRCQDPVVVLEHVDLYNSTGPGPVDDLDYCLPVGKAAVRRAGAEVTVLTYLAMTNYVLDAVEALGSVDAEVIDLRWLDRASIDWDTHRREHPQDQQRADRRAGRRRDVVRRLARRRDPAPLLRLARPAGAAGDRRRGLAEHQQGARAGRDRAERRGRRRPDRDDVRGES